MQLTTLIIYCLLIVAASLFGGVVPLVLKLSHRQMQLALSFVSGVMLGVALLHMIPHAAAEFEIAAQTGSPSAAGPGGHLIAIDRVVLWVLTGFLAMFLLERFFCFHHHEMDTCDDKKHQHHGTHAHAHNHTLSWTGALIGLTVHSLIAGTALAASVQAETNNSLTLIGFGTFLIIFLHKPFDSLTIGTLLIEGNRSRKTANLVNILFALTVPAGAFLFQMSASLESSSIHALTGVALAISAGVFLCISLSDVLPELQFHQHDRIKLTLALLAGLLLAYVIGMFEGNLHEHDEVEDQAAALVISNVNYHLL